MKVSEAFADIVRQRAYRGLNFDKSSMSVVEKYELGASAKQKLIDLALNDFGYANRAVADRAIHEILRQTDIDYGERRNEVSVDSIDSATTLSLDFSDATCLTMIYDNATDFIVLSDSGGVLRRGDVLQLLGMRLRSGGKLRGMVLRHGAAYPDSDHCYLSEAISGIKVMHAGNFSDNTPADGPAITLEGTYSVLCREPDSDGIFRISTVCGEGETPLFELRLDLMQYSVASGFKARDFDPEALSEAIAVSCDIMDGNNPLLLHTVAPGTLRLRCGGSEYILEIETKVKVSMSPRHENS